MTTATITRERKSEKLTTDEYKALARWVKDQPTKIDAALVIGISREVLDRVLIVKSGSPVTIEKIRKVLTQDVGTDAKP